MRVGGDAEQIGREGVPGQLLAVLEQVQRKMRVELQVALKAVPGGDNRRALKQVVVFLPQGEKALADDLHVGVWIGDEQEVGVGNGRCHLLRGLAAEKKNCF